VAGIDDWDEPALAALHDGGVADAAEIAQRIGMDQFSRGMARAWINDALGRRLIRRAGGARGARLYEIAEKGSARIGRPQPAPGERQRD
jgi:hypothetical protein